jgi:hypothetical protein
VTAQKPTSAAADAPPSPQTPKPGTDRRPGPTALCAGPGCTNTLTPYRRVFCSDTCRNNDKHRTRRLGAPLRDPTYRQPDGGAPDWTQAACHGQAADTEGFPWFPVAVDVHAPRQERQRTIAHNETGETLAKQVCNGTPGETGPCPIRDGCLDWALTVGEVGTWGGMTEDERHRLRTRQRRTA